MAHNSRVCDYANSNATPNANTTASMRQAARFDHFGETETEWIAFGRKCAKFMDGPAPYWLLPPPAPPSGRRACFFQCLSSFSDGIDGFLARNRKSKEVEVFIRFILSEISKSIDIFNRFLSPFDGN